MIENGDLKTLIKLSTKDYNPWYSKDNYTAHHTNGEGFVDFKDAEMFCKELPQLHLFMHDSGMVATHNIPCTVCKTNHAIFNTSEGVAYPCNECQEEGWALIKKTPKNKISWFDKYILGRC